MVPTPFISWFGYQERSISMYKAIVNFMNDESGPTAVEYAVMLALIVVVCIGAVTFIGTSANTTFSRAGSSVAS